MNDVTYSLLKYDLKKELRDKLAREYALSLDECDDAQADAEIEVYEELETELLQLEGRDAIGNDVQRERFIRKVFARREFIRIWNEPIDYSEFYNDDGSLKDTITP